MRHPEVLYSFEERREKYKPYGFTCELWKPELMNKPDRHNEIEINYLPEGNISYLFNDAKITISAKSLTIFWGLIPHQIVNHTNSIPYYVFTIPLTIFLEWKLPAFFVDKILGGEIIIENAGDHSSYDGFIMKKWIHDYSVEKDIKVIQLEMHARLLRMIKNVLPAKKNYGSQIRSCEVRTIEQIALFIAKNYSNPIKAGDICNIVSLHPDYANVIFKKAFGMTINNYIIYERISHAQRKLISTDKSITDILFDSGFNSISNFNRAFRKINNCTPKEYRKRFSHNENYRP